MYKKCQKKLSKCNQIYSETNNNLYKIKESQNVVAMELHNKVD